MPKEKDRAVTKENQAIPELPGELEVGPNVYSTSLRQLLVAGSFIRPEARFVFVIGSGGAVTLTSNPSIYSAVNGQMLTVIGLHDTNTVTLTDGNGMKMAGNMTLGAYDTITFMFDGLYSKNWLEVARSAN